MNVCYIGAKDNCGNWASGNVVSWGKSLTNLPSASSQDSVSVIKKLATDVSVIKLSCQDYLWTFISLRVFSC